MRLAILSDIHSNLEALREMYKVLEEQGCDKYICIGDIVGYGAKPSECIDFVREHNIESIRGNHDHYTTLDESEWDVQPYAGDVIRWTQDVISAEQMQWLESLPFYFDVEGLFFIHASLEAVDGSYWPYILDTKTALFHFFLQETQFAFFGHTHIPLYFVYDENHKISIEILKSRKAAPGENCKYLINPGSVGQPRDFDSRSSAIMFDTKTMELELLRAQYDIPKVQKQILDAGLPELLAERLSRGN